MSHGLGTVRAVDDIDDLGLTEALARACAEAGGKDFEGVVTVASALRGIARVATMTHSEVLLPDWNTTSSSTTSAELRTVRSGR
jgi:hypothetical protein